MKNRTAYLVQSVSFEEQISQYKSLVPVTKLRRVHTYSIGTTIFPTAINEDFGHFYDAERFTQSLGSQTPRLA